MTKYKFSNDIIATTVAESVNWAQVCRKLGVPPATGSQSHLKRRAVKAGIDSSHFTGQSWNKGRTFPPKRPIEEYLSGAYIGSSTLRDRIIKEGLKEAKCEICGKEEWQGVPIPLELDHKNCVHTDNRLENLQIICPNCHALKTRQDRANRRNNGPVV